jgi:hypothetical protein
LLGWLPNNVMSLLLQYAEQTFCSHGWNPNR